MQFTRQPQILALQFLKFVAVHRRFVQSAIIVSIIVSALFLAYAFVGTMTIAATGIGGSLVIAIVSLVIVSLVVSLFGLREPVAEVGYEYVDTQQKKLEDATVEEAH